MSVRRLAAEQPKSFAFSDDNLAWAKKQIEKYPEGRQASAVIPLMWRAQEQHDGWLPEPAIRYIADMLDMPYIRALEVATFYTMFQLQPVGKKAHIQVCGTTPCMLRGAGDIIKICKSRIAEHAHDLSKDGDFSWEEVECLGACVNAPMVQVWSDTYEDLTPETFEKLLDDFSAGKTPKPGPQNSRHTSEPEGGAVTLTDPSLYDGSMIKGAGVATRPAVTGEKPAAPSEAARPKDAELDQTDVKVSPPAAEEKPELLTAARDNGADDLKKISGVGPKLEKTLNELGIYHFDQVAAWSAEQIAWVDNRLKFKGRIERDGWIEQAKILAAGGETEFSKRQDKK